MTDAEECKWDCAAREVALGFAVHYCTYYDDELRNPRPAAIKMAIAIREDFAQHDRSLLIRLFAEAEADYRDHPPLADEGAA